MKSSRGRYIGVVLEVFWVYRKYIIDVIIYSRVKLENLFCVFDVRRCINNVKCFLLILYY